MSAGVADGAPHRFIFAYGSLMWRPDFRFRSRETAFLSGYARRLWQGSTDHRGTESAPGRVVTLAPEPGARCVGLLYEIEIHDAAEILAALDRREQGGYVAQELGVTRLSRGETVQALTYVALPNNPNYLGPAEADAIAEQVRSSRGPSGENREYVEKLALLLGELGALEPHIFEIERLLASSCVRP